MHSPVLIKTTWDDQAGVWVATSNELPGLVVETATTDQLEAELKLLVPELRHLNRVTAEGRLSI